MAPAVGSLKLNVDARFDCSAGVAVCGMVIQDHQGDAFLSVSTRFDGVVSPLHTKIRAILLGLEVTHQHGYQNHCVESDSLLAVLEIKKGFKTVSEWRSLILAILSFRNLCGISCFRFIVHDANELAHRIAQAHGWQNIIHVWHYGLPNGLCN